MCCRIYSKRTFYSHTSCADNPAGLNNVTTQHSVSSFTLQNFTFDRFGQKLKFYPSETEWNDIQTFFPPEPVILTILTRSLKI